MSKKRLHLPSLGPALKSARQSARVTQAELAELAGLSRAAVLQVEAGHGRLDTAIALVTQLSLRVEGKGLPPLKDSIGVRLAALRNTRGYSRRAASAKAGISVPTVAAIETGAENVLIAAVEKLAAALGVTPTLMPIDASPTDWFRSSAYDAWTTPLDLAHALADAVGGRFSIDVASPGAAESPIRASRHFTMADDGLKQSWSADTAFMNPPYGRTIAAWIAKAVSEVESKNVGMVVSVLPANTDTSYWHEYVEDGASYRRFIRGRLKFGDSTNSAPFGSAIVIWGGTEAQRKRVEAALDAWEESRNSRRAA